MLTFIKAQAASILGSIADFLTTIVLVEIFHCWYIIANLIGNIFGATAQFIFCRNWAFNASRKETGSQLIKFVLVWAGNFFLSAESVYLFTNHFHINYIVSKTITSVLLGVSYNYFLQKKFVFV